MGQMLCIEIVPLSTGFVYRQLQPQERGFDYAAAVRDIHRHMTYDEIAEFCGYENKASIHRVIQGAIPDHPRGEAIYILYMELFGHKPPPPKVSVGKPQTTP